MKKLISIVLVLFILMSSLGNIVNAESSNNSIYDEYKRIIESGKYSCYSLCDIDKNQTLELITYKIEPPMIGLEYMNKYICDIYSFTNNKAINTGNVTTYDMLCYWDKNGIWDYYCIGVQNFDYSLYVLNNNKIFDGDIWLSSDPDGYGGGHRIYCGNTISEMEFQNIINEIKPIEKFYDLSGLDILKPKELKVYLNGKEIKFDQPPIMAEGNRILVPIRKIAEAMGDEVLWNQDTQSAFIKHGEEALIIKLLEDNIKIVKNEQWKQWQEKQLDVPAMVLNGRTLVPVRAFCESLGADVKWVGEEKAAYITYDFGNKTKEMSGETFRNINTVYYALNNKATQFDTYSDDFNEFYDQRNHTADGIGMGVSDIWAGVKDLLSGLSNAENIMKDSLEQMLVSIPDNDIVVIDKELADDIKDYADNGKDIFDEINGIDDDFLKLHPELKSLDNSIDKLGKAYDAISFSAEQLEVILSNYTMNIDYLYTLKDNLKKSGMLNEELEVSISELEEEYSSKFLQILMNIQDKVVQDGISAVADAATGGIFGIGNFVWDTVFSATGVTKKGEALKTFYGLYCINGSLDKSYKDLFQKISSGNYTTNDVIQLKQLDDMQRALKITTYNSIENITNDKTTQEYCKKNAAALSKSSMLWKE